MTDGKIKWGILGLGNIARKFASDISLVEGATLVAVGSRDSTKAKLFAEEFSAARAYGSYEELVLDPEVDVIYVATPHSHHHANTLLCLDANKHVLCEKAFSVNTAQAVEMIAKAKEKRLFLMEALWTRFLPHYRELMKQLDAKTIGEIRSVTANFGFLPRTPVPQRLFDPHLAGGTILDIGIYNVFLAMSALGKPDAIEAHMSPADTGVDAQCSVLFKYDNGAMAHLFSTFQSHLATETHIAGTKGRFKLTHRFYAPEASIEYYPDFIESVQTIPVARDANGFGYQYEIRHVGDCLRNGLTESPEIPFTDTLQRMQVLDDIRSRAGIVYHEDAVLAAPPR